MIPDGERHDRADRPAASIDLSPPGQRIHVVGVGGAGMSAIAEVLCRMGHRVSGSDLKPSTNLDRLRALGVEIAVGHRAENVRRRPVPELLAISSAVPAANPEVRAAEADGIPVLRRAQVLAAIVSTRRAIAVAGTHGKTTTSSMLALVLRHAGLRPSFIIGGELNEIGSGAGWDDGPFLVVEADESDGTFLELRAEVAVLTSVEPDHLDHYGGDEASLTAAFGRFLAAAPGGRVACADDPGASRLAAAHGAVTYGESPDADYRLVDVHGDRAGSRFALDHDGRRLGEVRLPVPGRHNALNAAAALVTALSVGAPFDAAAEALSRYGGVARRFQFRGERGGVTFVDDYAHLPGEVRSVLAAAREGGWNRIVCVFQPHRYSRTAALWRDFGGAFGDADLLVVTDVYPAGEDPRPGVSGKLVVNAVLERFPTQEVAWLPRRAELLAYLRRTLRPGDLCLTLCAGDLTSLADELLAGERLADPAEEPDGSRAPG